jgi:alkanesulfonate monooxygenase SsuD/methylene tetrahydromethanopterin reductase-like flavin-dependent oxidoreductase (luciferase family)
MAGGSVRRLTFGEDDAMKVRFALSVGFGSPDPDLLGSIVTGAESRGFDGLWFSDLPLLPSTDPLLAVAFAAASSRRLKLGVNLVPFGRSPFVLARDLAQLDQLSGGRLLITIVPGLDQPGERAALGIQNADRGRLLDDIILVAALWAGERWRGRSRRAAGGALRQQLVEMWLAAADLRLSAARAAR